MAFTTSDTFTSCWYLALRISSGAVDCNAINTNGDFFGYTFGQGRHPTPEIGTQRHTDWEILQETWALNNGFLDENGDVITVYCLGNNVVGNNLTIEEHEAHGYYNPFREGSYEKYHQRNLR